MLFAPSMMTNNDITSRVNAPILKIALAVCLIAAVAAFSLGHAGARNSLQDSNVVGTVTATSTAMPSMTPTSIPTTKAPTQPPTATTTPLPPSKIPAQATTSKPASSTPTYQPGVTATHVVPTSTAVKAQANIVSASACSTLRIEAGNTSAYTDSSGNQWSADSGFSAGTTVDRGTISISPTPVTHLPPTRPTPHL